MQKIIACLAVAGSLITSHLSAQQSVQPEVAAVYARKNSSGPRERPNTPAPDKRDKLREALLPLLRGAFTRHWENTDVLLTIDAGWRNDSLSVEYKYYKGTNVLSLNEDMLIETIYFTVRPEEIDELDTENDEFLFLYLRNSGKNLKVHQLVSRHGAGGEEHNWRSSMGIPVRPENLQMIINYLKDLRTLE